MPPRHADPLAALLARAEREGECLLLRQPGSTYPRVTVSQVVQGAHRFVYDALYGIPPGADIHHTCGVKLCVNPDHLRAVDRRRHRRDAARERWRRAA